MITVRSTDFGTLLPPIICACLRRYHSVCYSSNRNKGPLGINQNMELVDQYLLPIPNRVMLPVVELSSPRRRVFLTAERRTSVGASHVATDL